MWIFLNNSFLSVVADRRSNRETLLVRARCEGDIERVFPDAVVEHTPSADYAYRTDVRRSTLASALSRAVENIDYWNFKDSVLEDDRHDAYFRCWSAMFALQTERRFPSGARGHSESPWDDWQADDRQEV